MFYQNVRQWVGTVTHCIVCLYVTSKIFFYFLIKDFYSITTKVLNQATLGGSDNYRILEFWIFGKWFINRVLLRILMFRVKMCLCKKPSGNHILIIFTLIKKKDFFHIY